MKKKAKEKIFLSATRRRGLIGVCLLVLVVLIIIAGIQWGMLKNPITANKKVHAENIPITDACSIIVGNLIHTIGDEGTCQSQCRAGCEVRNKKIMNSTFVKRDNDCNDCTCFCE